LSLNIPKSSSSYSESTIEGSGNSEGGLGSRKESSSKVMFGKPGTEDLGTNMRKLDNGFFLRFIVSALYDFGMPSL